MRGWKKFLLFVLGFSFWIGCGLVSAYGNEIMAYSADYRIQINGECVYGAVIIEDQVYIPLEVFQYLDNQEVALSREDETKYTIIINQQEEPAVTEDLTQVPFSWVRMGNVTSSPITCDVIYEDNKATIEDGFYTFQGEYPMVKLSKLKECMPIAVDYTDRIIYIGEADTAESIPVEEDLVGNIFPEIANRFWDAKTNLKSIHDYLVKTLYQPKGVVDMESKEVAASFDYSTNQALAGKYADNRQYAVLFREFCQRSGIACKMVVGKAQGEEHIWNKVFVDNQWYYVDVTLDDPIVNGKDSPHISHQFFLKTAQEMVGSHIWQDKDYTLPVFSEQWKELDVNQVSSQEMYIKCLVGQLAQKVPQIELTVTGKDVTGGLAFLDSYCQQGILRLETIKGSFENGRYRFDVVYKN